ncbi:hypothetical protein A8C56_00605 [Niabella ginsenosidivorans]|uniref:Uncharacterized protein n=1 Tax=Niabella ginsenosidivorans TaxID=1176587 RepID=A0A1A9HZ20_9BACT|nr:hypothetical protein A8C56_00605 [Niabella ginsenosidivorans]
MLLFVKIIIRRCYLKIKKNDRMGAFLASLIKKIPPDKKGLFYKDGLVSMGTKISHHNINYYFAFIKIISYKFYSHFKMACGYVATC